MGACLPLLAGAATTFATGKDEGIEALLAPTSDFTRLEQNEDMPGGGATSRGSTDTSNAFSLSSGNMSFRKELDSRSATASFAGSGSRRPPPRIPPMGSGRYSTRAAARTAT
ncbi:hypothetical protein [Methyloceanibacter marginalis]|uniref:hypothetical protein n=1 Tax=Methyloceanibacter marginalis TaxID=1774971 RepID=UPI001FCDE949|nr:hypothetical protein [Methyloceanibacter marginalis]